MPFSFLAIWCPILGFITPFPLCDLLRNNSKKKRLYDEYATSGIMVVGAIIRAETTVQRSSLTGIERNRTHKVTFAYRTPSGNNGNEESSLLCVKPNVDVHMLPTSRRVEVLVLPGYPYSGCLKMKIDRRDLDLNAFKTILGVIFCLVIHIAGIALLMAFIFCLDDDDTCADNNTQFVSATAGTSLTLLVIAYFCADCSFRSWKNKLLHHSVPVVRSRAGAGYQTVPSTDENNVAATAAAAPMAEVLAVLDGNDDDGDGDPNNHFQNELELMETGGGVAATASAATTTTMPAVATAVVVPSSNHTNRQQQQSSANNKTPAVVVVAQASLVEEHDERNLSFCQPSKNDEQSQQLREAVVENHQGDWKFLRDTFQKIRGKNMERSFYIGVLEKILEEYWDKQQVETTITTTTTKNKKKENTFSPILDAWVTAEPDNPDCCLVRGRCYIAYAWHARGSGYANTVGSDVWPQFFARIDQASMELNRVLELDPKDALAYAYSVTIAMARKGRREAEVRKLMAGLAQSSDPSNLNAHTSLLQFFCRKWGGSDEQMFYFARQATKDLPEGHALWILLVQAHYEVYLGMASVAQQVGRPVLVAAVANYWKRPEVRQEILHSYQQYVGSSKRPLTRTVAEESVLMHARNWFAFCLMKTGYADLARRELLAIGMNPTERPWNSLDRYQAICNEAGVSL